MNKVAIAFLTKDRVDLSKRTIKSLLQPDKFDIGGSTVRIRKQERRFLNLTGHSHVAKDIEIRSKPCDRTSKAAPTPPSSTR